MEVFVPGDDFLQEVYQSISNWLLQWNIIWTHKQKMLHILTITVKQIIHAFALAIENSQTLTWSRINFQK